MAALRWFLVLPAGILAAGIASFPLHWILLATFSGPNQMVQVSPEGLQDLERWLYAFAAPVVIINVGARVAPCRRMATALVLSLAYLAFVAFLLSRTSYILLMVVPNILGAIVGLVAARLTLKPQVTAEPSTADAG